MYNVKVIKYPDGSIHYRKFSNAILSKYELEDINADIMLDRLLYDNDDKKIANEMRSINSSLNRSKDNIYQLVHCNNWEWFVTLTFDSKFDRTDYDFLLKKLRKWLNNVKQRYASDLKYIIIPEEHKRIEENGKRAYHFHGLFSNCGNLEFTESFHKSGRAIYSKSGLRVYNILHYNLGFSSATRVQNTDRCSNYMTKYITKALCIRQKGKRRFLNSHNLEKPIVELYFMDDETFSNFLPIEDINYCKSVNCDIGSFHNQVDYYIKDSNTTNSQNK